MRVFMLGWEFPPFISGGLGTACYGLTRAMSALGTDIIFVIPRPVAMPFSTHVELVSPRPGSPLEAPETDLRLDEFDHVSFRTVDANLNPYARPAPPPAAVPPPPPRPSPAPPLPAQQVTPVPPPRTAPADVEEELPRTPGFLSGGGNAHYGGDLFTEVQRYAALATALARDETFDIVHAHDWMTYPAGMAVAGVKNVPLVVHVHSTEFDRSGVHIDQRIYDIERRGMHAATKVIAVSHLTKNQVTQGYGVDPGKVEVVHNAIEAADAHFDPEQYKIHHDERIVLFLGRITLQKGPEYFLAAAKKVLGVMNNVKFVMAGSGDMIRRTVEMAADLGIGHKVLFTGFLRGGDVERVFRMADLYVMPSVSEPFGIAPLEAMSHDVPILISKQSGVSEIIENALKVNFWDIDEMANKIIAVLRHPPLASTLRQHGSFEVRKLSWTDAARACLKVYDEAVAMMGTGRRATDTRERELR